MLFIQNLMSPKFALRFISILGILIQFSLNKAEAQAPGFTANDKIIPYTGSFKYGVNSGYEGPNWNDSSTAYLANKAGAGTLRVGLFDWILSLYGPASHKNFYSYYQNNTNLRDNVIFLNEASGPHTDSTIYNYPASTQTGNVPGPSLCFKNIYLPIWNADGSVDSANTFASYVYTIVRYYGANLKFYEVWNEPDINSGYGGSAAFGQPGNWYQNAPSPQDMYNLKCPIYYYIRMCRIAYEIVHRYSPNAYVCTGGIGYPQFLDCLLRYTDNPVDGSVTPNYPLAGGAYLDIISFHDYPGYNVHTYSNQLNKQIYSRHSDACVADYMQKTNSFRAELAKFGYDGTKFPAKPLICTETNVGSAKIITDTTMNGTPDYQRNYMMKAMVYSQKLDVKQLYMFALANNQADPNNATDVASWMGLFNDVENLHKGQETFTQEGIAFKTMSNLLTGYAYDSTATKKLALGSGMDGAAFSNGTVYRYVLWAKTSQDLNEKASANYTFPSALNYDQLKVYNWDAGINNLAFSTNNGSSLNLSGTPLIIEGVQTANLPVIANAGTNQTVVIPKAYSTYLNGTGSYSPTGKIVKYAWTKVGKSTGDTIIHSADSITMVKFSKAGVYNYQLMVWDSKGNKDSAFVSITVLDSTLKKKTDLGTLFKIYPNPALVNATISYQNSNTGTATLYIYDMSGRLFYKSTYQKTDTVLTAPLYVGNLGPGNYIAVMVMGASSSSFVLVNLP